jgi:hypothetical protein
MAMQGPKQYSMNAERGVSLSGLIVVLAVIGALAVVAMKVVPTYLEYRAISGALERAKQTGGSVGDLQRAFDKNGEINNVSSVRGRDLVISRDSGETELSFAYEKRVPLFGNVSLVIDYAGTTDKSGANPAKVQTTASAAQ